MRQIFGIKNQQKVPAVLTQQENPVNYDSVLDYLTGLDQAEYNRMVKVTNIYRTANKNAAKILGVKDEPTVQLTSDEPTRIEIDSAVNEVLGFDPQEEIIFEDDNLDTPEAPKPKKTQAPTRKVNIKRK